jgi:ribosomal protein S12 methylthiotransferase
LPRVSIVTLGCPKNSVDSEGLGGLLDAGGHRVVDDPHNADVVLVNTCGFIDPARRETVEEILDLAELKHEAGVKGLVLTGCLVARSAGDLAESLPEVDALIDFDAYGRVAEIVDEVAAGTLEQRIQGAPGTRFDPAWWDVTIAASPRIRFGRAPWAYVKIAEGCDRGCTFCAIPLMRGKFRSRPAEVVEAEARHLASMGVSEVSLVSQDSVMWGRDTGEGNLPSLLRRLEKVDGLRRIRLMYLHPQGLTDELIDLIASSDVVVSYFDLSLQHVARRVLKGMGRWGGRARFDAIIERIRGLDPLAAIRSTFIAGFPGETEDDFGEALAFVAESELDWIGVFTYSPEPGTRSYDMNGHVPEVIARDRAERLASLADEVMERRARSIVGSNVDVLVERLDLEQGAWSGRSHREAPEVDGEIRFAGDDLRVGQYATVRITGNDGADLIGEVVR